MADRLVAAREGLFVGRDAELATFEAAVTARQLPMCVLWIYGPGGVGKSTLLRALGRRCRALGIPLHTLDADQIEPTPPAFGGALRRAAALHEHPELEAGLGDERRVLLIDTYETLAPLDDWLRDVLLPLQTRRLGRARARSAVTVGSVSGSWGTGCSAGDRSRPLHGHHVRRSDKRRQMISK